MAETSVYDLEFAAAQIADTELIRPRQVVADVLNLATKLHANDTPVEELAGRQTVKLLLLQRVQNDLRCCMILVEHGYPLQAISLAAGIFEGWVTIASIKSDEDAKRWLSHERENESFGHIRPLTKEALISSLGHAKDIDIMYSQYQQLCMPKHLNPIVERVRGYTLDGQVIQFRPGPDTSEQAIRHGWYALERAARFAFFAFYNIALTEETPSDLLLSFSAQAEALNELQAQSSRRWPENYPTRDEKHQ